jgi:hypothetical protein
LSRDCLIEGGSFDRQSHLYGIKHEDLRAD